MKINLNDILLSAEKACAGLFKEIDKNELYLTRNIIKSFQNHGISARHFAGSTGYGYGDIGRDALESVYADILGGESALVRPSIASGTHALAVCLFGLLSPGDTMVSVTGAPYDTLHDIIGIAGSPVRGSLIASGINYKQIDLTEEGLIDIPKIQDVCLSGIRMIYIQRSRGYSWRTSLSIAEIKRICDIVHSIDKNIIVMVDNCYGEFVNDSEPLHVGADIMAGSLIKNIGGGLAQTGGYIAGKKHLVELASYRLTAPGIGGEVGSYAAGYQYYFQGLFLAPHVVAQALKGAIIMAYVYSKLGVTVTPAFDEHRSDIIQSFKLDTKQRLLAFCKGIQKCAPVDGFVLPEPADMPGYQAQVIMAAGTFVQGASIELSADAPVKPPYIVYLQGGLTYAHCIMGLESTLSELGYI